MRARALIHTHIHVYTQWGSRIIPFLAALFSGRKLRLSIASKNRQKAAVMAGKRKKNTAGLHCQRGARVAARRSSKPRQPFRKERKEEEERHARWIQQGGEGGRESRNACTLRRKDPLLSFTPLSSPVLHSKKKDSEGGVIGRLLLFHENGGKGENASRKRERRKDRGFRVLDHTNPGDHCTQRSPFEEIC